MKSSNIRQRRDFIGKALGLLGIAGLTGFSSQEVQKGKFIHMVYFWMKNPDDANGKKAFEENLVTFLKAVPVIRSYEIGTPANTPRSVVDNSYTYALMVTFNDKEAHDIYQEHSAHKAFIAETESLWSRVQIYDSLTIS